MTAWLDAQQRACCVCAKLSVSRAPSISRLASSADAHLLTPASRLQTIWSAAMGTAGGMRNKLRACKLQRFALRLMHVTTAAEEPLQPQEEDAEAGNPSELLHGCCQYVVFTDQRE